MNPHALVGPFRSPGSWGEESATGEVERPCARSRHTRLAGFTLIELMIVASILGALAALAIPNYQRVVERARIAKAIGDITVIGQAATEYFLTNDEYPASLADIGWDALMDPWGNPYRYLRVEGASRGALRKDRFLVPVNSDFDLYSMGPDGASRPPFTAAESRDDIVRANDGGYVGVAENY